ncbi:MAG: collagen-like protein [Acidimicrobiia bacterium]
MLKGLDLIQGKATRLGLGRRLLGPNPLNTPYGWRDYSLHLVDLRGMMRRLIDRSRRGGRRSQLLAGVLGALMATVLVSMGLAYAQTNGTDVYSGCLSPGGAVTDVAIGEEPLKECKGNKVAISWNQTGPEGLPGATGPQGPQGEVGPQGPEGNAAELAAIKSQLDSLFDVIQIDPNTGAVTISSGDANLILEAGADAEVMIESDTMVMGDATVMGETELEGDTMVMGDTTVMGETMLEGDTMLMQDAEFMGDATFEGGLVLPQTALTVIDGVLSPTSSSVTITAFSGPLFPLPLRRIVPAVNEGTVLEIHFGVSSDDIGIGGFVEPCFSFFVCLSTSDRNIQLTQRRFEPLRFENGDTLRLISRGDDWVEVSRSSGHVEAFTLIRTRDNFLGTTTMSARCTDPPLEGDTDPLAGRDGAVLLTSSVNIVSGDVEIISQQTVVDDDGTEEVSVTVNLPFTFPGPGPVNGPGHVQLVLRCLSI